MYNLVFPMNGELIPIIVAYEVPDETLKEVTDFNQRYCDLNQINFLLCIPHMTLWMGAVQVKQLPMLKGKLTRLYKKARVPVTFDKVKIYKGVDKDVLSLGVIKNRELINLHGEVCEIFEPHRMAFSRDTFNLSSLRYLNGFKSKSFEMYDPHITLGVGCGFNAVEFTSGIFLEPKIFEMGNYCTCIGVLG